MRGLVRLGSVLLVAGACSEPAPIESCDELLTGVYLVDGERWMLLDNRPRTQTLEAYPLFPDVPRVEGLEVAPRVIDFDASGSGVVRRRYIRGTFGCTSTVPARMTSCRGQALEIVIAEPAPPTGFGPCAFGMADPGRVTRWSRER